MKTLHGITLLGILSLMTLGLHAQEGGCRRCQEIREYNKTHHKNYDYYEDYLKDLKNGQADTQKEANPPTPQTTQDNKK